MKVKVNQMNAWYLMMIRQHTCIWEWWFIFHLTSVPCPTALNRTGKLKFSLNLPDLNKEVAVWAFDNKLLYSKQHLDWYCWGPGCTIRSHQHHVKVCKRASTWPRCTMSVSSLASSSGEKYIMFSFGSQVSINKYAMFGLTLTLSEKY